jgi:hypothetical protein
MVQPELEVDEEAKALEDIVHPASMASPRRPLLSQFLVQILGPREAFGAV